LTLPGLERMSWSWKAERGRGDKSGRWGARWGARTVVEKAGLVGVGGGELLVLDDDAAAEGAGRRQPSLVLVDGRDEQEVCEQPRWLASGDR